jgi:hypothetical protein
MVLAESHDVPVIVDAVTDYVARRMVEREQALSTSASEPKLPRRRRGGVYWSFAFGFILGALALFALAFFEALRTF